MSTNPDPKAAPTLAELRTWLKARPQFSVMRGAGVVIIARSRDGVPLAKGHDEEQVLRAFYATPMAKVSQPPKPRRRRINLQGGNFRCARI